jgi:hypothetical protein
MTSYLKLADQVTELRVTLVKLARRDAPIDGLALGTINDLAQLMVTRRLVD